MIFPALGRLLGSPNRFRCRRVIGFSATTSAGEPRDDDDSEDEAAEEAGDNDGVVRGGDCSSSSSSDSDEESSDNGSSKSSMIVWMIRVRLARPSRSSSSWDLDVSVVSDEPDADVSSKDRFGDRCSRAGGCNVLRLGGAGVGEVDGGGDVYVETGEAERAGVTGRGT